MPGRLQEHQNGHEYVDNFGFEQAVANVKKENKIPFAINIYIILYIL